MKQYIRLISLFRPFWGWAVLGTVLSIASMLANIMLLTTSAWFITAMGVAGLAGVSMNYFTPAAIIRGAAIIRTAGRYLERLVTHEATFRFLGHLRVTIFSQMIQTSLEKLEQTHSSRLSSRIQYDIETLQSFYIRVIVPISASVFTAFLCILYAFQYEYVVALPIMSGLLIAGILVPIVAYYMARKNAQNIFISAEVLKEKTVDYLDGLGELITFSGLQVTQEKFHQAMEHRLSILEKDETYGLVVKNTLWLISQFTFLATLVLAADLLQGQKLSQADFVMISMFALASFESVSQIAPALIQLPQNKAAAERIFAFQPQDEPAEITSSEIAPPINLCLHDVSYSYHPYQTQTISYDFNVPFGTHLLLKGVSGIGKSTLIDLLVGHRRTYHGDITLNGYSVKQLHTDQLNTIFSVATQNIQIFSGSIEENLTLGCSNCTRSALNEVLEICELTQLIDQFSDGLSTYIGEQGFNLSGGQQRRLCVARALLKPSSILILDEPTEGLDSDTAQKMMFKIQQKCVGKSLIVISHHTLPRMVFDQVVDICQPASKI